MRPALILAALTVPLLSGCVSTVASVVTAPVKVVAKAADWATTSQDESDRNLGRKLRNREEELGKLARQREKAAARCRDGREAECARAETLDDQIEELRAAPL